MDFFLHLIGHYQVPCPCLAVREPGRAIPPGTQVLPLDEKGQSGCCGELTTVGTTTQKGTCPQDGTPQAPGVARARRSSPERVPRERLELGFGQSTFPSRAPTPGSGPAPLALLEACLQLLLVLAEQTFGTVVSLESSTCCSNDPSFHWKFSESDLSEGAGSDECSENASQSFLEAPAVGVFTLLCLEKGF